jgi:hypothetical protein
VITDPSRLLPWCTGWHSLDSVGLQRTPRCWCGDEATVGAIHRRFGRQVTCAAHDPARAAMAVVMGYDEPTRNPAPARDDQDGGRRARLSPPLPVRPSPAVANPL